jgi:site-specific recombinase XerD
MSALAPTLEAFFTERLLRQRRASPHTVASYRDTFSLLLRFIEHQRGKAPCGLDFSDLDAPTIGAFLDHLEVDRHNGVATRNARLVAIHSLFTFAALRHPEHAELIARVLAIPPKRTERALVSFLSPTEVDALLGTPDRASWTGRRDHALLVVAIQTGLRVSELVGLCCGDVALDTGAHVRCEGKGRKERVTPLTATTVGALRPGWPNAKAPRATHCSRRGQAARSVATPSSDSLRSMRRPPRCAVRRSPASELRLTS